MFFKISVKILSFNFNFVPIFVLILLLFFLFIFSSIFVTLIEFALHVCARSFFSVEENEGINNRNR